MSVLLALAAAFAFGSSVALQEQAAAAVPEQHALRLTLLARVARRPLWLLGVLSSVIGLLLQGWALKFGSLVIVQPVMATALVFALALLAVRTRDILQPREWIAIGAVLVGVVGFLAFAAPADAGLSPGGSAWWTTGAVFAVAVCSSAMLALRYGGRRRAAGFGLAAGLCNGFVAVLTKAVARDLPGVSHLLLGWPIWALLAVGLPALVLVQSIYQAGNLQVSLPVLAVVEPISAAAAGLLLFHERLLLPGARVLAVAGALAIAVVGLVHLATNPRLTRPARLTARGPDTSAG